MASIVFTWDRLGCQAINTATALVNTIRYKYNSIVFWGGQRWLACKKVRENVYKEHEVKFMIHVCDGMCIFTLEYPESIIIHIKN